MFSSSPSQTQSVSSPFGKGTQRETLMSIFQRIQKGPYIQFQPLHRWSWRNPAPQEPLCLNLGSTLAVDTEIFLGLCYSPFQPCSRAILLNQRPIQWLGRNPPRDLLGVTPIPTPGSRSTDWMPNSGLWNRNLAKWQPIEQATGGSPIHPPEL